MLDHPVVTLILGILALGGGILLRLIVGRNRFNRRGVGGLQQFSSYTKALAVTGFERFLRIVGMLLILGGIFVIVIYTYNHKTAAKYKQQVEQKKG